MERTMPDDTDRALRETVEAFIGERCQAKLDKLKPDDDSHYEKRQAVIDHHRRENWLADATRRVAQLQVVTHALKATHPDARGTSLFAPPETLPAHPAVGTHVLGDGAPRDVVGNAAALDVYKFLQTEHDGRSMLDRALAGEAAFAAALSDDPAQGQAWMEAFAGITRAGHDQASHTRAKQVYWLVDDDPTDDRGFHLLAPLYATSLAHAVFHAINEDRFGEAAKAARTARRERRYSAVESREYPKLAVQKFGGTKPQNISQLNSERRGSNYLLASLPPDWRSADVRAPLHTDSVFPLFGRRRPVRSAVNALLRFLRSDPKPNVETRRHRDELLAELTDALLVFAAELSALPPGWSGHADCHLVEAECLWLDPDRAAEDAEFAARRAQVDWPQEVRERFADWLNGQLRDALPVADAERRFWADRLEAEMDELEEALPHV
ncbi:type I-F CRISPR-associated protein Csy1 [Arhodomonas sp. AD133]|uniref:type I-F CRISPR-associated protein Csy1 n=1 Tax=Arhodomonas sp. AD133 TaxID=3415009 RepID=UPI003EBB1A04